LGAAMIGQSQSRAQETNPSAAKDSSVRDPAQHRRKNIVHRNRNVIRKTGGCGSGVLCRSRAAGTTAQRASSHQRAFRVQACDRLPARVQLLPGVSQTRLLQVGFLSICVNCAFGLSKHRERMSEMETLVPSSDQRLISSSHGSPYSIALGRCFVLESAFPQV
jgi:hypothetical protein